MDLLGGKVNWVVKDVVLLEIFYVFVVRRKRGFGARVLVVLNASVSCVVLSDVDLFDRHVCAA